MIDALAPVIDWHRRHLVPLRPSLADDPRCEFVHGNFFELAAAGFDVDAVLVDIDHSPRHLLDPGNASFYERAGMERLARSIRPGGVFSLWSNDPPDDAFVSVLDATFDSVAAEIVTFDNVLTGTETSSTIYVATRR